MRSLSGAITFYTCLPLPLWWPQEFKRIARFAPLVGVFVGVGLWGVDVGLMSLGMPPLTRSSLIVALWLAVTGGLHLDGAMDTADGLAVLDPQRRLTVMQDSVTGAFGAMTAGIILLLKVTALTELSPDWGVVYALGWGRWGQVAAIAFYPYLKPQGKGAFHKQNLRLPQDILVGFVVLWGLTGLQILYHPHQWLFPLWASLLGGVISVCVGGWFYRQLGGQTGDTYGAIVEWTEALILCGLTLVNS
ncbi:adenosylcobinamide-GDP ribazoletransferase [Spirulina sp. CS-785/01]|uniref:adenosylcobinamide-GDP ribazoletransferase n=1 Tax=Spirulina sp. CS-785/01 TaxID=3021716 RepID=UPI00232B26A6|nr:adenosylcobinamide-GDP ribazoletransferase [Spirulina sp. CS-785/01]MDB9315189.1 adenosylcobinamide-GDP ribazoletransferase [Spirulina sp. CS-785/01]